MKKFLLFLLFAFGVTLVDAQTISEKNVTSGASYGESNFKRAPKRVYISGFRVNFNVVASAASSAVLSKTAMTVALESVDATDFQKLTDEAYNQFVGYLKSKGYEIISVEEAAKTEYYAGWIPKEGGNLSSSQYKGFVSVSPTGFKYLIKNETAKGKEKTTFVDTSAKLSKELAAATIINVEYTFPLFEMDESKSNYLSTSSVKAKINYQMGATMRIVSAERMGKEAILTLTPKGNYMDIEAPVFKDKKIKERTVAFNSSYLPYVTEVERTVTHLVTADHDLYVGEAGRLMKEFSAYCINEFHGFSSK